MNSGLIAAFRNRFSRKNLKLVTSFLLLSPSRLPLTLVLGSF
uniref:Uncharacterized protein n=1 Tax=Utricularia reniformis TaxID=192314 RepID=A0A1Y0B3I4_9LAMI|nr:hypothetical protein AEK19_MT1769 [Utricularia reniformis]ART31943.1 hypothetical protein AEK19_MT1769 [Utricularia reniformis]